MGPNWDPGLDAWFRHMSKKLRGSGLNSETRFEKSSVTLTSFTEDSVTLANRFDSTQLVAVYPVESAHLNLEKST